MTSELLKAVETALDKGRPADGREVVDNTERGCGFLKPNSAYVRTDLAALGSPKGEIPPWVSFDDPIEYREHTGKGAIIPGWVAFPGNSFTLHYVADEKDTTPAGDIYHHVDRLMRYGFDGDHYGEITSAHAHDLLMSVGKTNWPEPDDFIRECKTRGLNLKIPVSDRQEPPAIEPFRTRCFVIHPHGCGENRPGIIGYAYLTRTIFTTGTKATEDDPDIAAWAKDYADTGKFDVVERGEPIPEDEVPDGPTIADFVPTDDPDLRDEPRDVATVTYQDGLEGGGYEVEFGRPDIPRGDRMDSFIRAMEDGPLQYNHLKVVAANRDEVDPGQSPKKGELIKALVDDAGAFVPAYHERESSEYGGGSNA